MNLSLMVLIFMIVLIILNSWIKIDDKLFCILLITLNLVFNKDWLEDIALNAVLRANLTSIQFNSNGNLKNKLLASRSPIGFFGLYGNNLVLSMLPIQRAILQIFILL